jgi:hypothetical protein
MIAPTRLSIARLGSTQQQLLRELEAEFDCWIVAYEQDAELAQLTPKGHVKLRQLENELGVALVAYEPTVTFPRKSGHRIMRLLPLPAVG